MDHVGLKGHAKAVLEYVCTVYGHSIARVTSANRSNVKMSSQGDDFEDNLDISDHAQGPQVGGNSDFFHGDKQHGAVAQTLVETMERIIDERLEKKSNSCKRLQF